MGLCIFLVYDWGVFQFARREREHTERLNDSHSGNLGTDLFGEKDTLLDGLGREIRRLRSNGDAPERIRELLGDAFELRFEPGTTTLRMPNAESVWELFINGYGPTKALAASCDHSGGSS